MKIIINIFFISLFILYNPQNGFSQNWEIQNSNTTYTLNCVFFIDYNKGWVVGNGGTILHTTSGGSIWESQTSGIPYILNGVYFLNEFTGFVCGYSGIVLKTTNGGANWNNSNNGVSNTFNLYKIKFVNNITGYTSGTGGKFLKTTDCGNNWDTVFSFYSQYYTTYDFLFMDENTGWSCNSSNYIFRTSNGGYYWTLVGGGGAGYNSRSITKSQFFIWVCREYANDLARSDNGLSFYQLANNLNMTSYSISFINDYTGFASGIGGIKKSINSGENWSSEYSSSGTTFYSLFIFNENNMWCAGSNGVIVAKRLANGISSTVILINKNNLYDNYPNPFNPSTKIKFDVVKSGNVKIIVYDIIGREVKTLVNEKLSPGTYETTFDAAGLSSGIYFYKLTTDGFSQTKKMLFLK
jgi:photosystem II stability/assembly factor-like uncharacterized protein